MHILKRVVTNLNPFIFYLPILYGLLKLFDYMIGVDSSLQIVWDKVREKGGDNLAFYNLGILFGFIFIFYHVIIVIFYMIVKVMKRDKIKYMKLQAKDSELDTPENTKKVSHTQS
jgi:uncharacterized membrane protein YciS (DUF1049 family)